MKNRQLYRLAACLIGAASLLLQSCSESRFKDCDRLCGSWSSVEGKPDVLIYKEGDAYKVTVFARSGKTRKREVGKPICWWKKTVTCSSIPATA